MKKNMEEEIKALFESDEFRKAVEERATLMEEEDQVQEEAPWIGQTGLSDDLERELPRYLRREFGVTIFDEGSLKAADLEYLGAFPENDGVTHYWKVSGQKIPFQNEPDAFAYIEDFEGGCMGWGDKGPPK